MGIPGSTGDVVVDALGVAVAIPADADLAARLRHQWSRALTDRPPETMADLTGLDPADALTTDYAITSRVTMAALTLTAGRRLNIHAGAVCDTAGRTIAVIGASGSGKTTAIAHLARRLGYLSDETLSLDDDLVVHAHPKPLSVVLDRSAPRTKASMSPDDLGLGVPPAGARLHRVVLLRRGGEGTGLELLDTPRAIVEIVAQTSSLVLLDHPILRLTETLEACGGAWALHYDEIADWLDELVALLDQAPPPQTARVHHPRPAPQAPAPPGTWQRSAWVDAVQFGDEVVVMVDDTAHLLAGLGVVTWLALASPRTTEDLLAHAQEVLGEHPDAPALVAQALDELAERGLVVPPG